jgi:hypothetical protein
MENSFDVEGYDLTSLYARDVLAEDHLLGVSLPKLGLKSIF